MEKTGYRTRSIEVRTALAVVFIALQLLAVVHTNALAAPAGSPADNANAEYAIEVIDLDATVRLEHRWDVQQGSDVMVGIAYSLGTAIGPRTILPHNHFEPDTGKLDNEWITLTENDGDIARFSIADMAREPMDGETMLFGLPDDLTVPTASIADRATVNRLAVGDWLTVVYWDDPNERVAYQDFKIIKVATGIAVLADPEWIINSGDSGGGAYLAGKLVGNTWKIATDENDRPLGRVTIALVPPQIVE